MKIFTFLLIVLFPVVSYAEVSDKIPNLTNIWVLSIVLGIFAFIASLRFKLAILFAALTSVFLAYGFYDMYADPSFREAVYLEQGVGYFYHGYTSAFLVIVLAFLGYYLKRSGFA